MNKIFYSKKRYSMICDSCKIHFMKYENQYFHRKTAPARIYISGTFDRSKEWWINNELHRINGPAEEFFLNTDMNVVNIWWFRGRKILEETYWNC